MSECKRMCRENEDETETIHHVDPVIPNKEFIVSFESPTINRRHSIENVVETEVTQYLMDPNKEPCMLKHYPTVRAVFYK